MKAITLGALPAQALQELDELYRTTKLARIRTRAQMLLLSAEQGLKAAQIAQFVRESERTVQRWLNRYQVEGVPGLRDAPRSGKPGKVTQTYQDKLLESVRRRPRALGLDFSLWTLERLSDYMAQQTGVRIRAEAVRQHLKAGGIVLSRPQHQISSPDPEYQIKKRRWKRKEST
jgi:transposase